MSRGIHALKRSTNETGPDRHRNLYKYCIIDACDSENNKRGSDSDRVGRKLHVGKFAGDARKSSVGDT